MSSIVDFVSETTKQLNQSEVNSNHLLTETIDKVDDLCIELIGNINDLNNKLSDLIEQSDAKKIMNLKESVHHATYVKIGRKWAQMILWKNINQNSCKLVISNYESLGNKEMSNLKQTFNNFMRKFNYHFNHSWGGLYQRFNEQEPNENIVLAATKSMIQRATRQLFVIKDLERITLNLLKSNNDKSFQMIEPEEEVIEDDQFSDSDSDGQIDGKRRSSSSGEIAGYSNILEFES